VSRRKNLPFDDRVVTMTEALQKSCRLENAWLKYGSLRSKEQDEYRILADLTESLFYRFDASL
jgi:hypothetical protein